MSFEKIKQYYLLCTIKAGGNKRHVISDFTPEQVHKMFMKKELNMHYIKTDSGYIIREKFIGGSSKNDESTAPTRGIILVF